jgi:hypothetical protein
MVVINDDAEVPSLLHPMTGKIFLTNRVGTRVIQLADGVLTVDEIVARIVEQYRGADREVVSKEVVAFLEESTAKGLILWEEGSRQ